MGYLRALQWYASIVLHKQKWGKISDKNCLLWNPSSYMINDWYSHEHKSWKCVNHTQWAVLSLKNIRYYFVHCITMNQFETKQNSLYNFQREWNYLDACRLHCSRARSPLCSRIIAQMINAHPMPTIVLKKMATWSPMSKNKMPPPIAHKF